MSKQHYKVGDIFRFKIDQDRHGYGQVITESQITPKCFIIFDIATSAEMDLQAIAKTKWLIKAHTVDAKLDNGDWEIIGNEPVQDHKTSSQEYIVSTISGSVVESYNGKIHRPATSKDLSQLRTRKSYSPAALEYAIKAHLGLVEWKDFCNELMVNNKSNKTH